MKVCSRCKTEQPLENFWNQSRYPDWLRKWCRKCEAIYYQQTKNNSSVRESKRKADIKYHKKNRELICLKGRTRHKQNKEYDNFVCNQWYKNNRDYVLNVYIKINSEQFRVRSAERRALKVTQSDWTVNQECLNYLWLNQNGCCAMCWCDLSQLPSNKRNLDHIYPISKWWLHSIYNLQRTCQRCNFSKWAKIIETA